MVRPRVIVRRGGGGGSILLAIALLGVGAVATWYFVHRHGPAPAGPLGEPTPVAVAQKRLPRFFVQKESPGGYRDAYRVEAVPDRANGKEGDLIWENGTDVELLADWKSDKPPGSTFMRHYVLVRHKANPAVEGWVFPLYLWFGPIECSKCGKATSIREKAWGEDAKDLEGRPLACPQCGETLPRVERQQIPKRTPPFIR